MKKYSFSLLLCLLGSSIQGQQQAALTRKQKDLFENTKKGKHQAVEKLLKQNVNPNFLIKSGPNSNAYTTPFILACLLGHMKIVRCFIKHKADIELSDTSGQTPLLASALANKEKIVLMLLEEGANPVCYTSINEPRFSGLSPLIAAAEHNFTEAIEVLLGSAQNKLSDAEFKRYLNHTSGTKDSAVYSACTHDNVEILKILLSWRADPNIPNPSSGTALHFAAYRNRMEIAHVLLGHEDVEINLLDGSQKSPLALAVIQEHTKMANLLREHGAKSDLPVGLSLEGHLLQTLSNQGNFEPSPDLSLKELQITTEEFAQIVGSKKMVKAVSSCSFCGKGGNLKTCKGCYEEYYCKDACQKAHWNTHMVQCKERAKRKEQTEISKITDTIELSEDTSAQTSSQQIDSLSLQRSRALCGNESCKKPGPKSTCAGCKNVHYCNSNCQKADWKNHKLRCEELRVQAAENIES